MLHRKPSDYYMESLRAAAREMRTCEYVKGAAQYTDMTNTEYFLKIYGERVRYCKQWKKFLVWNGKQWLIDENGDVETLVNRLIRSMYKIAPTIKDIQRRIDFESHIKKSESLRRRKALIESLSMDEHIKTPPETFDQNPYAFNCKNGTMYLDRGEFKPHKPGDYSTKCSNFIYDIKATCPTWEKFLLQIMNQDKELIRYVQKVMGYSMTSMTSEQCMFILWGAGANGKSTFLNTLSNLMGDYAEHTQAETFMKKQNESINNDVARLRAVRFVSTSETEQGKRLSESLVKQVTGDDNMTARFLYGEFFSFKPTFKIFMATNHKPQIKGNDFGIWRRIRLIPFTVTIPEEQRDKDLQQKLEAENAGIFNWMMQGYLAWKHEGLSTPETVKNATDEYRADMDVVGQFVKDCCFVDASEKTRVSNKMLYEAYVAWCNANNEKVCSQKFLAMRLQEKGFRKIMGSTERYWLGLGLREKEK